MGIEYLVIERDKNLNSSKWKMLAYCIMEINIQYLKDETACFNNIQDVLW